MSPTTAQPAVGFIGLGDQGLPPATAMAEAGYPLDVVNQEWNQGSNSLLAVYHARRRRQVV